MLKNLNASQPVGLYVNPLKVVLGFHLILQEAKHVYCLKPVLKSTQMLNLYLAKKNVIIAFVSNLEVYLNLSNFALIILPT